MKVVHQNLLLLFGYNVEDSEKEESQEIVEGPSDCIQAVSYDAEAETEVMSKDSEPDIEGDTINVQSVHTVYEPNYCINTIWGWVKSIFGTNNIKLLPRDSVVGILWSNLYPRLHKPCYISSIVCPSQFRKSQGEGDNST